MVTRELLVKCRALAAHLLTVGSGFDLNVYADKAVGLADIVFWELDEVLSVLED